MERKEDTEGGVLWRMNTVGEMEGGSSSLGSSPVVNAVLVLVIIATGTQIAKEMKRKTASNDTFIFFSFLFLARVGR